jgi:hypothetical protein
VRLVYGPEVCPANELLQKFVAWWAASGPFPIKVVEGRRTDAEQLSRFQHGRQRLYAESWVVTNQAAIVTNARWASDSAHGHDAAIDCYPVRELYHSGAVRLVYLGNEGDPLVRAEALRRLEIYADLVEEHGLESGRNFPGLRDLPHAQDPAWRTRPVAPGVALRT